MTDYVTWPGSGNNEYKFECYRWGAEFNPFSGIYIACKTSDFAHFNALYVGKAKSFKNRLNSGSKNHDGLKRAEAAGATHICAMLVAAESDRAAIEVELIQRLNPPCNKNLLNVGSILMGK